MSRKILLTGPPGCGKTTLIRKIAQSLGQGANGFYTEERVESGRRIGFDIVTLDGRRAPLSHVKSRTRYRVGKYGVNIEAIDSVAVPSIENAIAQCRTVIVDEIGKMELFSERFKSAVQRAISAPNPLIAVIMLKSNPFADSIKSVPGVRIINISPANRDLLLRDILEALGIT
ncbi:MAG: NTPase [Candidatus Lindowbacteria bacterium]|nr:NTPase [Candidatus Lindowbacteria bacterium]